MTSFTVVCYQPVIFLNIHTPVLLWLPATTSILMLLLLYYLCRFRLIHQFSLFTTNYISEDLHTMLYKCDFLVL